MSHRHRRASVTASLRSETVSIVDPSLARREVRTLLDQVIRLRAYELYLARGDTTGNALDDWLHAEREYLGVDSLSEPVPIAPSRRGLNGASAR